VRKGIFFIPFFFIPPILFPCFAFSGEGGGFEGLRDALLAGGIAFEEGPAFPDAAGTGEAGGSFPLFVVSVPLTGAPDEIAYYVSVCENLEKNSPPSADIAMVFSGDRDERFVVSRFGGGRKGGEGGFSEYADIFGDAGNTLFWRLDFERFPPQSLQIEYAPEGEKAPLFLVEELPALCDSLGIPYTLIGNPAGGEREGKDELIKFVRGLDIGALRVRGMGQGPEENSGGLGAARLSELIGAYALDKGGFDSGKLTINADYNYSLVGLPWGVLFIPEKIKVLAALFAFAAINLAAVILFFTGGFRKSRFRDRPAVKK
jgi:hypothetical protein